MIARSFRPPWSAARAPDVSEISDAPAARSTTATQTHTLSAAELHARHLDDVFRYVSRRLPRREDAEDVTAETFAAAFEHLHRFRGDVEPRLWLLGIARRKVADALRKSSNRELSGHDAPEDEVSPVDDPARALSRDESRRALHRVLSGLNPEHREALLLKYVEELTIEQIAVVLNRSPQAANSLLQRARAAAFKRGHAYFLDFQADDTNEVTP